MVTTENGVAGTKTVPVDVSVHTAKATLADGSYRKAVLLSPSVVEKLKDAAQKACGGKRSKRQTFAACVQSSLELQNTGANIIKVGTAPDALAGLGGIALAKISAEAYHLYADTDSIPPSIHYDDTSTSMPALPSSTLIPPKTGISSKTSTIGSSSSLTSSPIISTATVPPKGKSQSATSTASTSTVEPNICWKYTGTDVSMLEMDPDDIDDTDTAGMPQLRARDDSSNLEKRRDRIVNRIGKSCALGSPLRIIPDYWKASEMMGWTPQQQWWYVASQENRNYQSCSVAAIVHKGKRDDTIPSFGEDNFPEPYNTLRDGINVEHVCECITNSGYPLASRPR